MPNININRRLLFSQNNILVPPPITGYTFWFRADGLFNGTSNRYGTADASGNVSQLSDLGGSSISATQGTALRQPLLVSSTIGTRLRKAVRFTAASLQDFTVNNALTLTNNISAITIYVVAKVNTGGATGFTMYFSTNASGSSRADIRTIAANTWQVSGRRLDADGVATVAGNSSTSAYKIVGGVIDYANSDGYEYENSAIVNTNNSFETNGNTSATNSATVNLGSSNGGNYFDGDIGEVLIYVGAAHSATQVAQVHSWLNDFYGIY